MTAGTDKEEAEQLVSAAPKVQSYLEGRQIRKVIVVPERLVNIVCGGKKCWFLKRQFYLMLFPLVQVRVPETLFSQYIIVLTDVNLSIEPCQCVRIIPISEG